MDHKNINRRDFLRRLSKGVAVTGLALAGCDSASRPTASSATASGEPDAGKMTYRNNPKTGEKVSILGYGCMRWPMMPNPAGEGEVIDQDAVNRLVDYAIAHGVNYFDTAPPYVRGLSEEATGIALSRHPRERYYIATKMSNHRLAGNGLSPQELFDASVAMYKNSLKQLRTDYIDYYLLHTIGGGSGMPFLNERFFDNGLLDYLLKEREAGRIRNLGFSYHGDIKVFDYLLSRHDEYKWDFAQIQLNYLDWKHAKATNERNTDAEYLYHELEKRNIPAVIMEPLLGGRLAKVPDYAVADMKQRDPDRSVASWAFRFAGSFPGVHTVLSGMTEMEHLKDNLRSLAPLKPLTDDDFAFLERIATKMVTMDTIPCNDCKYCMPCPYGIDIPSILQHYNKCVNDDHLPQDVGDPDYREARRAFLVGYDRSVPKLRQASHCIGCGQCAPHCPQRIDIPAELHRIDRYVEQLKQNFPKKA